MGIMYYSLKTVPVRLETLGQFTAANPWNGNPAENWTLGLYVLISESYAPSLKWKQMRNEQAQTVDPATRRRAVQDRKLKMSQTIGFESSDGRQHMLPRILNDLWQSGEVPDQAVPALLKQLEPKLKKSDFKMNLKRFIFKGEAIMLLIFGLTALTVWLINRMPTNSTRTQVEMAQVSWLGRPMSEHAIWAKGDGVTLDDYVGLGKGAVHPPQELTTWGPLNLLGWFKAQNETRLVLMDVSQSQLRLHAPVPKFVLRGVVLPATKLGMPQQFLDTLAEKIPNLNKDFLLIYNAEWPDPGGTLHLGENARFLLWIGPFLLLPFVALLLCSRFWRRRDEWLKEEFRTALLQRGLGTTLAHPA
jgi:hypothetical protein